MHRENHQILMLKMRFSGNVIQCSFAGSIGGVWDGSFFHVGNAARCTAHANEFSGLGGRGEEGERGLEKQDGTHDVDGDVVEQFRGFDG